MFLHVNVSIMILNILFGVERAAMPSHLGWEIVEVAGSFISNLLTCPRILGR